MRKRSSQDIPAGESGAVHVSIQVKIVALILVSLILTTMAVLFFAVTTQKNSLLSAADRTLNMNSETLNQTIRAIMLNGEAGIAVRTMENLENVQGIENLEIYRTSSVTAFTNYETIDFVNSYQKKYQFEKTERHPEKTLYNNYFQEVIDTNTPVKVENKIMRTLEYYYPLINTPECRSCHGTERFLRGIAYTKISTNFVYDQIDRVRLILSVILILAGIVTGLIIILFMRRIIIQPLLQIGSVLQGVGRGRMDIQVPVTTRDELGMIAGFTNNMITSLKHRTEEVQITQDVTIMSLASLAETRDNETGEHIIRTQHYVKILAEHLSLDEEMINLLFKSAPLHDIGKVGIPDSILLKPGPLDEDEWVVMKTHTILGYESLRISGEKLGTSSFLRIAREITLSHHEKWDGSGYSQGLAGRDIPLSGRLMALADVYDALISERVYKKAFTHEKTTEIINSSRGTHFDPDVADAFFTRQMDFRDVAEQYRSEPRHVDGLEEN